jgi:acetoacetyl-[acyl-carrier protein] synthase
LFCEFNMPRLPVIVGFGGVNPAGRSSFHHGYRRLVIDSLTNTDAEKTYKSLAGLMNMEYGESLSSDQKKYILEHSLIRKIESAAFDCDEVSWNKRMLVTPSSDGAISFISKTRSLPDFTPEGWQVIDLGDGTSRVNINSQTEFLTPTTRRAPVQAAGQLPTGFNPGNLYQARSHPRGLQLSVYGASDALLSTGVDWETICSKVAPDEVSVYAGSAMGQLDQDGHGGMLGGRHNDKRTTSKHCPFGLAEMPADFINAYVLGSVGNT